MSEDQALINKYITEIDLLFNDSKYNKVWNILDEGLKEYPDNINLLIKKAELLYLGTLYKESINISSDLLKKNVQNPELFETLVKSIIVFHYDLEKASALIFNGQKLFPENIKLKTVVALIEFCNKNYNQSMEVIEAILGQDNENKLAITVKALNHFALKQELNAKVELRRLFKLDNNCLVVSNISPIIYRNGLYKKVYSFLKTISEEDFDRMGLNLKIVKINYFNNHPLRFPIAYLSKNKINDKTIVLIMLGIFVLNIILAIILGPPYPAKFEFYQLFQLLHPLFVYILPVTFIIPVIYIIYLLFYKFFLDDFDSL